MTGVPPVLDRYADELEAAVRRDLAGRRARRRVLRVVTLAAAAAAATLVILSVLPARGPSVVERAAAALTASAGDTILHFELRGEQRNPDGSVVAWRSESWQLRAAPFTRRAIEFGSDGVRAETMTRGETTYLYDAGTNTIYVSDAETDPPPEQRPRLIGPGERPGTVRVAVTKYKIGSDGWTETRGTLVMTEKAAQRLIARYDRSQPEPEPVEEPFREEILKLLESGRARDGGRIEVGGRDAIRIESPDGRQSYLVDAGTYAPIEWTTRGDGGGVTLRFPVYEELPADAESMRLLDLAAQHPGARVERDADAYRAAEARLFPRG